MRKKINERVLLDYLTQLQLDTKTKFLSISVKDPCYTRTETIHALFDDLGIEYHFINDYPSVFRYVTSVMRLFLHIKNYDVVLLHFRSYETFFGVWFICKLFWKKLITDHFVSIRDTVCFDRKVVNPHSLLGKFLLRYDKMIIRLSDFILIDTIAYKNYFITQLQCPEHKIGHLYVWCNKKLFYPRPVEKDSKAFKVFRYGNVLPIQWADVILQAAKLCEDDPDIQFTFVWPIGKTHRELTESLALKQAAFIDRLAYEDIPLEMCKSDLFLGWHFSTIDKAKRVIAGKTFQSLACGVPTVVSDNEANRELFMDQENIHRVNMEDALWLSSLIKRIKAYDKKTHPQSSL